MPIAEGLDTNNTQSTSTGTMLYGLYYYYLDNSLLESNKDYSIPLQLPTIQTLTYLPFFNLNELTVVKSKIDSDYFKLNENYKNVDVFRLMIGGLKKELPTHNIQDSITSYYNSNYPSGLLLYPYRYFLLSDGVNPPMMIKPQELLTQNTITPVVETYITQNSKYKIYVKEFKNDTNGEINSIVNNISLLLPIGTNAYNNFLVTNGNTYQATNNIALLENDKSLSQTMNNLNLSSEQTNVSSAIGMISNLFSLDFGGATNSAVDFYYRNKNYNLSKNQIQENYDFKNYQIETNMLATKKDYLNTPRTMKTLGNDALFNLDNTKGQLKLYEFRINPNQQYRLMKYYKNYGYKINKYKKPNYTSKKHYNFIKTTNCNIDSANIPLEHIRQLEQIFNSGLTFWHVETGVKVGDYTVKNDDVEVTKEC